jgi:MinD superfamily P-loop ATPase
MKMIGITGGKGGTGKSTFASLYALKLVKEGKKVILVDADVECPDDHLLFGIEIKKEKDIFEPYPSLNKEKCTKCGLCSKVCKENAVFFTKGKYPIFLKDLCTSCGTCWLVCPKGAIETKNKQTGEIFSTKIKKNLWLITGLSNSKVTETGPIVRKTIEFAKEFAEKEKADFIIIDSAAGLHCPVISAIINCDKLFAVTEATPLGEHDVALALELTQKLNLPTEIVINKSNIGDKEFIYKVASKMKLKIFKEIPYNKKIIDAYSNGKINSVEGIL